MMIITTNKQTSMFPSLPLANKSILYQGHFVSSVFVDRLSVDIIKSKNVLHHPASLSSSEQ